MDAVSPALPKSLKWHEVWRDVFLHPSEKTFEAILEDTAALPRRVYIWSAVVGLLSGILQALTNPPDITIIRQILTVIAAPVIAVFGLAFVAAFLHWNSRRFKGQGTYARMVYAIGAIAAPGGLIAMILSSLSSLGGLIFSIVQIAFDLFIVYLTAQAIKAVEKLDNKKAYSSLILLLLLGALFAVCSITVMALLGPALGNVSK